MIDFLLWRISPYLLVAVAAPLALIDFPGAFVLCVLAIAIRWGAST